MDKLQQIREAVIDWFYQEFAHVPSHGGDVLTSNNKDVFSGVYGYEVEVTLEAILTDKTYTITDTSTGEEISFGIDDFDHMIYNTMFNGVPDFESELLGDMYTEFFEMIDDPDYDVYGRVF